jgi:hypothetical protein
VISKKHFINKLRELGYTFKDRQKRTELWRKKGGTHSVDVPLTNEVSEMYVKSALHQCGLSETEIQAFIRDAKA